MSLWLLIMLDMQLNLNNFDFLFKCLNPLFYRCLSVCDVLMYIFGGSLKTLTIFMGFILTTSLLSDFTNLFFGVLEIQGIFRG